ncbi:hypothetical protein, partial [Burkholderia thailandensis]|uniref:hypothetical protein n=1 Tax=Burkholderia thailandensis TaxID=57975 RepID=UPI001CA48A49
SSLHPESPATSPNRRIADALLVILRTIEFAWVCDEAGLPRRRNAFAALDATSSRFGGGM